MYGSSSRPARRSLLRRLRLPSSTLALLCLWGPCDTGYASGFQHLARLLERSVIRCLSTLRWYCIIATAPFGGCRALLLRPRLAVDLSDSCAEAHTLPIQLLPPAFQARAITSPALPTLPYLLSHAPNCSSLDPCCQLRTPVPPSRASLQPLPPPRLPGPTCTTPLVPRPPPAPAPCPHPALPCPHLQRAREVTMSSRSRSRLLSDSRGMRSLPLTTATTKGDSARLSAGLSRLPGWAAEEAHGATIPRVDGFARLQRG